MRRLAALSCSGMIWFAGAVALAQPTPADIAPPAASPVAPTRYAPPLETPPSAAATQGAYAPALDAPPPPPPATEQPPAAVPDVPAPHSPPPDGNPYVYARGHQRWTEADREHVRQMLAEQRARRLRAAEQAERDPGPRVYGDAGAPVSIGLDIHTSYLNDVGFKHFEGRGTRPRFGVFASYDVATLARKLILAAELGASFESADAPALLGTSSSSSLDSQTFHGALDLRWDVLSFLATQLRASGGVSLFQIELADRERSYRTEHSVSGFGALGAGVLFHTPARTFETRNGKVSSLGLGVLFEGGYALRSPVDVALHAKRVDREIPVVDASLGRLSLSSAYFRAALLVRF